MVHTRISLVQSRIQAQTKLVVTVPEVLTLVIRVRMVKVVLMLDRLVKSQSLVLFIKEKGMFDKNLLASFFLLSKIDFAIKPWSNSA